MICYPHKIMYSHSVGLPQEQQSSTSCTDTLHKPFLHSIIWNSWLNDELSQDVIPMIPGCVRLPNVRWYTVFCFSSHKIWPKRMDNVFPHFTWLTRILCKRETQSSNSGREACLCASCRLLAKIDLGTKDNRCKWCVYTIHYLICQFSYIFDVIENIKII